MRPMFWCIGLFFLMMFGLEVPHLRAQQPKSSLVSVDGFKTELISRFMVQQCLDCHSTDSPEGGLDLSSFAKQGPTSETLDLWIKVHDRVVAGEMPPKGKLKFSKISPTIQVQGADIEEGYHNLSHHGKNQKKLQRMGLEVDRFATSTGTMRGLNPI